MSKSLDRIWAWQGKCQKVSLSLSLSLSRTQSHTHTHTHLKDKAGDILYFFISLTNPMNAAIYLKKTKTHDIRRRCTGWHVPEYSLKVVPANLPCLSDMSSFITMNFGTTWWKSHTQNSWCCKNTWVTKGRETNSLFILVRVIKPSVSSHFFNENILIK